MSGKIVVSVDAQIAALVPRFLANRAADVAKIRLALADGDFATIRFAAHGMKGSGGGYGLPEISRLGMAMEQSAQQRDVTAIRELVAALESYLAQLEITPGGASPGDG